MLLVTIYLFDLIRFTFPSSATISSIWMTMDVIQSDNFGGHQWLYGSDTGLLTGVTLVYILFCSELHIFF